MFHRLSKHLEFRQKYSAARRIFNSLLGVWISDETLSLVFDILLLEYSGSPRKGTPSGHRLFTALYFLVLNVYSQRAKHDEYRPSRDFPQTKPNSEINAPFFLNEHGDLYLLLHNFPVQIIIFKLKIKKKLFGRKKKI